MGRLRRSRIALAIMAMSGVLVLYHNDWSLQHRQHPSSSTAFWSSYLARRKSYGQARWTEPHLPKDFVQGPSQLKFGDDGLVHGWDGMDAQLHRDTTGPKEKRQLRMMMQHHPIELLVERGEERWADLLEQQSATLAQAAWEYRNRYGRHPPKGFDTWWRFVEDHAIIIVDQYDQMNRDIEPFFALSPRKFRSYARAAHDDTTSFRITLDPNGTVSLDGARADSNEAKLLLSLLTPLASFLPVSVTLPISNNGPGMRLLSQGQRMLITRALSDKRYLSEEELKKFEHGSVKKDLAPACLSRTSASRHSPDSHSGQSTTGATETTFIHDVLATCHICSSPLNPILQNEVVSDKISQNPLRPILYSSKLPHSLGFLIPSLGLHQNATRPGAHTRATGWESKSLNKLLWRGRPAGDISSDVLDKTRRTQLAAMTGAREGEREVLVDRGGEWKKEAWGLTRLNERYMDVGFVENRSQCEGDGVCQDVSGGERPEQRVITDDLAASKYVLDLDERGPSRSHRLLSSSSVLVKATVFPEWNSDWLTPWAHYVPTQVDYSDLYSILSFFVGPPDGRRPGHDDLARQIAENGRNFAEDHWRWEDMQAYMLRLLLEYARLEADNRDAFSYDQADL